MATSFFSRRNSRGADRQASQRETPVQAPPSASALAAAVERWRAQVVEVTDAEGRGVPRLTITQAHPGGLARLYTEAPTRLSSLIREKASLARAMERARAMMARSLQLSTRHGVGRVHLSIGQVQWHRDGHTVRSAALLKPVRLDDVGGDVMITLEPGALMDPDLEAALREHGEHCDAEAILDGARSSHGFSASVALSLLRERVGVLDGVEVRDELVLGIFEHPATPLLRDLEDLDRLADSPLVRALAGDEDAVGSLAVSLPPPNPRDRDPWKERGIGDLTPAQQDAVEAVATGDSLVVDAPVDSDATSVIAAILADAAASGRSVLHVGASPSHTIRARARLMELGVDEIFADFDGRSRDSYGLADKVRTAMEDTSPVMDQREVDEMRTRLRGTRASLLAYTDALRRPYRNFGVSAAHALRVLTDLTEEEDAPSTRVRLDEDTLYEIALDQGERARAVLHTASERGYLRDDPDSAWKGAVVSSEAEVADVLERVERLAESLPRLRVHMSAVAGETGARDAHTLEQWELQLAMFEGVAEAVDIFQPQIFERSAADMVIATASKQWRSDHGITMKRRERNRLVKQARDYVRPGIHVPDLHRALIRVQERRDAWRKICGDDGWPVVPAQLSECEELTARVRADLEAIAPVFAAEQPNLVGTHVAKLTELVQEWAADKAGARELPGRVALWKEIDGLGLRALAEDFAARGVGAPMIDAELDLAWWASLLSLMLAADPSLGGLEPSRVSALLAEGRDLDERQVASLVPQAISSLRRLRTSALATRAAQHEELRDAVTAEDHVPSDAELICSHPLVRRLIPVVLTSPALVPECVRPGHHVDLAVIDGADSVPLGELIPVIARARQVVVVADVAGGAEGGAIAGLARVLPSVRLEQRPDRLNDQVALLLARYGLGHSGVPVPWTASNAPVGAVWCAGTGMPALRGNAIETTTTEVETVVDLVLAHGVESPERSLAVIALSERHAARIRSAVDRLRANEPGLAAFFDSASVQPFVVVGPGQAQGIVRDRVIISVGFAKTPHGRVIHDFGVLSTDDGARVMADVLRCVRGELTLVSSLHSADIDRSRIHREGVHMLVDLLEIAEGHSGEGADAWPVLEGEPDRLLIDLADKLYERGYQAIANIGIPGGVRIPLAVGHPDVPDRLLVAVMTDDEAYCDEPSVRVRDRVRPWMLEDQGWRVAMALSMPLFIDPDHEADSIGALVDALVADSRAHDALPVLEVPRPAPARAESAVESAPAGGAAEPAPDAAYGAAGPVDGPWGDAAAPEAEDAPARGASPRSVPVLDEELDEASKRRRNVDEVTTGMLLAIQKKERASEEDRGPRPAIAKGLPLAAYSDDQLDEMAAWVRSDGVERSDIETAEELRLALGITRRGFQSDAVLGNVVRRTKPVSAPAAGAAAPGVPGGQDRGAADGGGLPVDGDYDDGSDDGAGTTGAADDRDADE